MSVVAVAAFVVFAIGRMAEQSRQEGRIELAKRKHEGGRRVVALE